MQRTAVSGCLECVCVGGGGEWGGGHLWLGIPSGTLSFDKTGWGGRALPLGVCSARRPSMFWFSRTVPFPLSLLTRDGECPLPFPGCALLRRWLLYLLLSLTVPGKRVHFIQGEHRGNGWARNSPGKGGLLGLWL